MGAGHRPGRSLPFRLQFFWLAAAIALCVCAGESRAAAPGPNPAELINSVLGRQDAVFVSCPKGLYRASTTGKKWIPLKVEDRIPPNGLFAETAPAVSSIYYYTPRIPKDKTRTFGLYRADPSGDKWELLSAEYNFKYVYVHQDKTIYGIVEITEERDGQTIYYDRILRSTDSGKHWEDISHDTGLGVELAGIFQDPDHKELVCLWASTARLLVMQADDKSYKWKSTAEWGWRRNHAPKDSFFADKYATSTIAFMLHATLSNYFDYPFGNRAEISSFKITVGGRREFKQKEPIVVPITITFLNEYDDSVEMLDTDHGYACWGLFCIAPDGTQPNLRPLPNMSIGDRRM